MKISRRRLRALINEEISIIKEAPIAPMPEPMAGRGIDSTSSVEDRLKYLEEYTLKLSQVDAARHAKILRYLEQYIPEFKIQR
jgi:hypothetical protein